MYLPSGPVNITNMQEVLSSSKNEQQKHHQDNHGVTAIMAELKMEPDQIKAGNHTTSNKGPKQENKKGICWTADQMETYCSPRKEQPNTSPTQLGRCQSHGARWMGISKGMERQYPG